MIKRSGLWTIVGVSLVLAVSVGSVILSKKSGTQARLDALDAMASARIKEVKITVPAGDSRVEVAISPERVRAVRRQLLEDRLVQDEKIRDPKFSEKIRDQVLLKKPMFVRIEATLAQGQKQTFWITVSDTRDCGAVRSGARKTTWSRLAREACLTSPEIATALRPAGAEDAIEFAFEEILESERDGVLERLVQKEMRAQAVDRALDSKRS